MIYDKGAKNAQQGKDSLLNKWYWKTGYPHTKNEFGPLPLYGVPYTNINSEFIKDLNVRPTTLKQLEEKQEKCFRILDLTMIFWI